MIRTPIKILVYTVATLVAAIVGSQYGFDRGVEEGYNRGVNESIEAFYKHCDPFTTFKFHDDEREFACGVIPDIIREKSIEL